MAFDHTNQGDAKSDPLAAFKIRLTLDHEALPRNVDQMQLQFTQLPVLTNRNEVDWVTRGASHLGHGEPPPGFMLRAGTNALAGRLGIDADRYIPVRERYRTTEC